MHDYDVILVIIHNEFRKVSGLVYICVLAGTDFASISMILLLDVGTVSTV